MMIERMEPTGAANPLEEGFLEKIQMPDRSRELLQSGLNIDYV